MKPNDGHPPPGDLPGPTLCDADMRVLDFLAEHGFDPSRLHLLPPEDQPRAMALIRQMGVLDQYPADAGQDALVQATLDRIDRWEAAHERAMRIGRGGLSAFRLSDFVAVAAVIIFGLGVLLPIAARAREQRMETGCANNLRTLHTGLGGYARDHGDYLPLRASMGSMLPALGADAGTESRAAATAPARTEARAPRDARPAPQPEMQLHARLQSVVVVQGPHVLTAIFMQTNSNIIESNHGRNLDLLSGQYVEAHALTCPACALGRPCLAYRVPSPGERFMMGGPGRHVLVADANPLVEALRDGTTVPARTANSRNHQGEGQNLLFKDGSVDWATSPLLRSPGSGFTDNIWLPRHLDGREGLEGAHLPVNETDNFVSQ